jgi:uncharacterized protein
VVVSCVNSVGVDLNQASQELLTYVSGLGPQLARNILAFRRENGPFRSREQLGDIPRLGPKASSNAQAFCESATARTLWMPAQFTPRATRWLRR